METGGKMGYVRDEGQGCQGCGIHTVAWEQQSAGAVPSGSAVLQNDAETVREWAEAGRRVGGPRGGTGEVQKRGAGCQRKPGHLDLGMAGHQTGGQRRSLLFLEATLPSVRVELSQQATLTWPAASGLSNKLQAISFTPGRDGPSWGMEQQLLVGLVCVCVCVCVCVGGGGGEGWWSVSSWDEKVDMARKAGVGGGRPRLGCASLGHVSRDGTALLQRLGP